MASMSTNVISYVFVFVFQFLMLFVYIFYGSHVDSEAEKTWIDRSVMKSETGFIYAVGRMENNGKAGDRLMRYDVSKMAWEAVDTGVNKSLFPFVWDFRDDVFAYVKDIPNWKDNTLEVANIKTNTDMAKVSGIIRDVRISPDLSKLAILEFVRDAGEPIDGRSYYRLGDACRLKIYDTNSGQLLEDGPRMAINMGLTWLDDAENILFVSFRDEGMLLNDNLPPIGKGRGYSKDGKLAPYLYSFNMKSKVVEEYVQGQEPTYVHSTKTVFYIRDSGTYQKEIWQKNIVTGENVLRMADADSFRSLDTISPSGRVLITRIPMHRILSGGSFATAIDIQNPSRRFIIKPPVSVTYRWMER